MCFCRVRSMFFCMRLSLPDIPRWIHMILSSGACITSCLPSLFMELKELFSNNWVRSWDVQRVWR